MVSTGLIKFLRGNTVPAVSMPGCSNYDHHRGGCLFCWHNCKNDDCLTCIDFQAHSYCKVGQGNRCSYFEKVVLPTGDDNIRQKYEGLTGVYVKGAAVNLCGDCGARIPAGRRYCDNCRRKRRQATYRRNRDKRNMTCATVK